MQVFISYAFSDTEIMKTLRKELRKYGIKTYVAVHDLKLGEPISKKIEDAIEKTDAIIVVITKNSAISPSVNQEFAFAKAKGIRIIPLVEKGAKTGVLLQGMEYIGLERGRIPEICKKILEYLRRIQKDNTIDKLAKGLTQVLVDETKIIEQGKYEPYVFDLEEEEVLEINISSDNPINVFIVDKRNFRRFYNDSDFDYEGQEYVTRWNGTFACEKKGEWTIILDNTEGDEDTEVDIKVIARFSIFEAQ